MEKFTYLNNVKIYESSIAELFATYDYDLVIYDEIENFRNYNDDQFHYPYSKRKTNALTLKFNYKLHDIEHINQVDDYEYSHQNLIFMLSDTCLETSYMY